MCTGIHPGLHRVRIHVHRMQPRVFFAVGLLIHTASYPFVCRPCTLGKSKRASNDFVVDYVAGVKLVYLHKQKNTTRPCNLSTIFWVVATSRCCALDEFWLFCPKSIRKTVTEVIDKGVEVIDDVVHL